MKKSDEILENLYVLTNEMNESVFVTLEDGKVYISVYQASGYMESRIELSPDEIEELGNGCLHIASMAKKGAEK